MVKLGRRPVSNGNGSARLPRTVVFGADEVDSYSVNEINEQIIQAKLEAEILEATTQELLLQVKLHIKS